MSDENLDLGVLLNLMTDFGFKWLFGNARNKKFLIHFLNSILAKELVIQDLEYLPTEHLGRNIHDRIAIFDLLCRASTGEQILIELQKTSQYHFADRTLFYSTFPIQSQAKKGEWNYHLKRVYTIGILNFVFDTADSRVISQKQIMDTKTHKVYTDALKIIQIEVPKVTQQLPKNPTGLELWIWLLKFGPQLSHVEKMKIINNPLFKELLDILLLDKFNEKDLGQYRQAMLNEKHYKNFNSTLPLGKVKLLL